MLQIFIALLAGVLTVGAPCILPVLPILLGGSVAQTGKNRPLFITIGFIVTFAGAALLFAGLSNVLGLGQQELRTAAIFLLGIFGFFLIWPKPFEIISAHLGSYITKIIKFSSHSGGNFGGFMLGASLGLVWTPCAGPVLGSILTLIATSTDLKRAGILLTAYALGAGILMLAIAYGGQYVTTRVRGIAKYSVQIQQAFGLMILGLAVAMYFQYDLVIQQKILDHFPNLVPNL